MQNREFGLWYLLRLPSNSIAGIYVTSYKTIWFQKQADTVLSALYHPGSKASLSSSSSEKRQRAQATSVHEKCLWPNSALLFAVTEVSFSPVTDIFCTEVRQFLYLLPKKRNCFVCCYEAVQITWTKDKVHGVYTSHHMLQQLSLSAEPSYSRRSTRKMGNQDLGRNEDFSYACCGKACTAMALHTVQLLTPLTKAPARHIWISGLLFGLSSQSLPHRLTKIFITQSMCVMGGSLLHTLVNMKLFFVVWFSSQMCQSCNGDWCFLCWASRLSSWAALDL